MTQKFSDNARALLQSSITSLATTLTVESSKADRFPVANTTDWFKAVLIDSSGNREVIKVNVRVLGSGVFSSIVRAQDGTTAQAFAAGSLVICPILASDILNVLAGIYTTLGVTTLNIATKATQGGFEGRITPVGGIIMWSGSVASIPAGWALCDGNNGTPNLKDKFVVGAGAAYAPGATGGSKDAVVVSHTHSATLTGTSGAAGAHNHSLSDPGHAHNFTESSSLGGGGQPLGAVNNSAGTGTTANATTGLGIAAAADHQHSLSVSGSTGSTGGSPTNANLPPYYALAYIMCKAS